AGSGQQREKAATSATAGHDPPVDWPFRDHPELGVFVTRSVLSGAERPLIVNHDDEGDWIFAGTVEADDVPDSDLLLVHLHHVVDQYPECLALADLPEGM